MIEETEATELTLAIQGGECARSQRQASGSYYTPADVADHVWDQFRRIHEVDSAASFRALISRKHFIEPSAGSGIFVLTLIRQALRYGLLPHELSALRFTVIDINFAALKFLNHKLRELESVLGISLPGIGLVQRDFLDWAKHARFDSIAFVGNPPFVSNPRGSRWRNLYADFLSAMLDYPALEKSISLILPISICFSRDYASLRISIEQSGLGISASSYDNIPDCLFKSGKPESTNTNRANSQRCTILNLGGPDPARREASSLQRWATRERGKVLRSVPNYLEYTGYGFDGQIPRPISREILRYLEQREGAVPARTLMSRHGRIEFAIAGVARNFIGIREVTEKATGVIPIRANTENDRLILLQIFGSSVFYDYWRSVGDGFHITSDLVDRFPISEKLMAKCVENLPFARQVWQDRHNVRKSKLNSGHVVHSYDFQEKFGYLKLD